MVIIPEQAFTAADESQSSMVSPSQITGGLDVAGVWGGGRYKKKPDDVSVEHADARADGVSGDRKRTRRRRHVVSDGNAGDKKKVSPGFEPGILGSKPKVLTITLRNHVK